MNEERSAAVTRLAREESGHVLALLAARYGLDVAADAVQDALVEALRWQAEPANPSSWLYTVARNRAVDALRRQSAALRRERRAAVELGRIQPLDPRLEEAEQEVVLVVDEREVGDEQLRLMLLCCHPALARNSQIALTLRLVGGLTTGEIAAALLIPEATLAQRIVRAKQKICNAGIPLTVPARLDERIDALLGVLYLVFNEGYLSRGPTQAGRLDLMEESIRLTIVLYEQVPDNAEVAGLLALELFTRARAASRFHDGRIVLLEHQDRSLWDRELIAQADAVLGRSLQRASPGAYALQASIAQRHAAASQWETADWLGIASLYSLLLDVVPTPIVALNHAVAVSMTDGPLAGLALIDVLPGLQDYYLFWAVRGELLARAGRAADAVSDLQRALVKVVNPAEQLHLEGRIAELSPHDGQ